LSELIEPLHGVEILPKARLLEFRVVQARSSPVNLVSARMRPDKSPRHSAP
jgi:hypothetical protein